MKHLNASCRRSGSALAVVLITTAVLSGITAVLLTVTLNRRQTVAQSSVWQEALAAAEAGVHQGVAQLERALSQNCLPTNQQTNVGQTFTLDLPHVGEDSNRATAQYTITRNDVMVGGMVRPYYCIISTGTVSIPGGKSVSLDSRDVVLRKLNIANGITGNTVTTASRTVEAWLKPVYNTDSALKADGLITLNNFKIYVDSFDSNDSTRSALNGQPGNTVGQFNIAPYNIMMAHVATNSQFISAGDASIFGDALTNGGTVGGTAGIQGEIRDDYFEPMSPVYPPDWASTVPPGIATSKKPSTTNVNSAATIRGGTAASPARYVVDSVSLAGSSDVVTFDFGLTGQSADPNKNFVELYVRGDFTTRGGGTNSLDSGSVVIVNGVRVKIWVLGNLDFSGNGMTNNSGLASTFSMYAVNGPTPNTGQTVTLAGKSRFYGTIYAPGAALKLAGGGSDGTFVGSLAAKTALLNGNTSIRYDEALSGNGLITRFNLCSWFEDTKKHGSFSGVMQP